MSRGAATSAPVPLDRAEILRRMDANIVEMHRIHVRHVEGGEIHDRDEMTLVYAPLGEVVHNPLIVSGPTTVESICAEADRVFRSQGRKYSLMLRAHADRDLEAGLTEAGYLYFFSTPGMTMTPERWQPRALDLANLEMRPVRDAADVRVYGEIVAEGFGVYGIDKATLRAFFMRLGSVLGDGTQGFIGYLDGEPVTCATLYVSDGVAGVGWVATHPAHFGKRLAEAATQAVVDEGFRRGLPIASLQASPMGHAVYARMGFDAPTRYKIFIHASAK